MERNVLWNLKRPFTLFIDTSELSQDNEIQIPIIRSINSRIQLVTSSSKLEKWNEKSQVLHTGKSLTKSWGLRTMNG